MNDGLSAAALGESVRRIATRVDAIRDELNAVDRVLGDGDTGMTIAAVVAAWLAALDSPANDAAALLQQLGRETRRATGSSLGSVLAIGLIAAARQAQGNRAGEGGRACEGGAAGEAGADNGDVIPRATLVAMLTAAAESITERSGASPGDKTILDSVLAVREGLAAATSGAPLMAAAIGAATGALETFRPRQSKIGRARMYAERSVGHDDPGMRAAVLLLSAAA